MVVDIAIAFNALLGCPWIDKNVVIPNTYHQSIRYLVWGGQGTIQPDNDPFAVAKAYYMDAMVYKGQPNAGQGNEPPFTGISLSKLDSPGWSHKTDDPIGMHKRGNLSSVGSKRKGPKPIIFHAMGNMDNHSVSKVEDKKNEPQELIFIAKV